MVVEDLWFYSSVSIMEIDCVKVTQWALSDVLILKNLLTLKIPQNSREGIKSQFVKIPA